MTHRSIGRALQRLGLLALVWATLTGGVFSGCSGLFTPATPERPTTAPVIPNYSSAEATLTTMVEAIQAKDQGTDAWVGAFADSIAEAGGPHFHIIFDTNDVIVCDCPAPTIWRRTDERQFYLEFMQLSLSATYGAIFTEVADDPDLTPPTDSEVLIHRNYRVLATEESGNTSVIAIGRADLTFRKVSADRWLITRWVDHMSDQADPNEAEQKTLGRRRLE